MVTQRPPERGPDHDAGSQALVDDAEMQPATASPPRARCRGSLTNIRAAGTVIDRDRVTAALRAAIRAPSAHNAQPWRLSPSGPDAFLLWYAYADKLRADPDDRDGLMAVGGFYETMHLAAHAVGLDTTFVPREVGHRSGITLGEIRFGPLIGAPDPLASSVDRRRCNRFKYDPTPLPPGLTAELARLGNLLLPVSPIVPLVERASILSWKDGRFVSDLEEWTRFDDRSPDGMTFDCLRVNRFDAVALRVALALGRLPGWLAWCYAQRDVRLTRASSAMAVLTVEDRSVPSLFDAGRRLIRSWTVINQLGHAWHPMSVVIDQATVRQLTTLIDGADPVAIYRVGYTPNVAAVSKRRPLDVVVVPAPV
jgi:hypothetical protein